MFWSKKVEFLEHFQLENLILNQTQFHFFLLENLNSKERPKILSSALATTVEELKEKVLEQKFLQHEPIVLVCKNGNESERFAKWLMGKDFINVYVLEDGFQSLNEKI